MTEVQRDGVPDCWCADAYAHNAGFVAELGRPLLALLDPQPGERILDLGCGDGALTEAIAASGASVLGVDASPAMVAACQDRGLDALVMDGEQLALPGSFDAVFSNAALHWMTDAPAVLAGVAKTLKPGGRFVGEFGGQGNIAAIATALRAVLAGRGRDPASVWFFPAVEEYAGLLALHGFETRSIMLITRPTQLPRGIAGWLATFAAPLLHGVPEDEGRAILEQVEHVLAPALCDASGVWTADYVRLRFAAYLRSQPRVPCCQ